MNQRKPKTSTQNQELDFHKSVEPITTGAVVDDCVRHYQGIFPQYSARETVASLVGISYQELCAIIANERPCKLSVFCSIARVCLYPKAFDDLKHLNFPESVRKVV